MDTQIWRHIHTYLVLTLMVGILLLYPAAPRTVLRTYVALDRYWLKARMRDSIEK